MYINNKMKLNKFRKVEIPKARDLYLRGMKLVGEIPSQYAGDDYIPPMNKTEGMDYMQNRLEYEEMMRKENNEGAPTE